MPDFLKQLRLFKSLKIPDKIKTIRQNFNLGSALRTFLGEKRRAPSLLEWVSIDNCHLLIFTWKVIPENRNKMASRVTSCTESNVLAVSYSTCESGGYLPSCEAAR